MPDLGSTHDAFETARRTVTTIMRLFGFIAVVLTVAARDSAAEAVETMHRDDIANMQQQQHLQLDDIESVSPRPIFRPSPQNITVSPGDKAILKCRVDHLGTKTVIWRKANDASPLTIGNFPFAADARISVDYNQRSSEWTLMIQDIGTSDEGLYICQVSTKDASEHMFTVHLNVKTIQVSGMHVVESGEPIQLFCNATGRPEPPHNIEWVKDGQTVNSDIQRGLIVTKKIETKLLASVLSIRSSRQSDAGEYVCLSSDMESASITVIVVNVPATVGKRGAGHREPIVYRPKSSASPTSFRSTSSFATSATVVAIAVAIVTSMTPFQRDVVST